MTIWRSWTPNGKVQQFLRMLQQGTKALKKSVQFQFWQSGDDVLAVVHDEVQIVQLNKVWSHRRFEFPFGISW